MGSICWQLCAIYYSKIVEGLHRQFLSKGFTSCLKAKMQKSVYSAGCRHFEPVKCSEYCISFAFPRSRFGPLHVLHKYWRLARKKSKKTVFSEYSGIFGKFYGNPQRFANKFFKNILETLLFLDMMALGNKTIKKGGHIFFSTHQISIYN